MFSKLQILSVCSPEVYINYMIKTYSEVINIQLSLPCYRNPLVRYKRNQTGSLLEQAKNPVIQFIVILLYLNGKKKRHIFVFNYIVHLIPI